jgi:hypothetical protein
MTIKLGVIGFARSAFILSDSVYRKLYCLIVKI